MKKQLKTIAPWIVAAAIFGYLFHLYPPRQVWNSLSYVKIVPFLLFAVIYFVWIYAADVFSVTRVFKRFGYPLTMKELLPVRGVTYLIMILNYAAAQAGFAFYLKRTHRFPIFEVLGFLFFIALIDIYWIITLALIGSFFQNPVVGGVAINPMLRMICLGAYLLLGLNFLVWHWKQPRQWRMIRWLHSKKIFLVFKEAAFRDYVWLAMLRAPMHLTIIASFFLLFKIFQAEISLFAVLANIPLVMLVGIIPITPGGLGTSNMAMVELLRPHLSGSVFQITSISPAELLFTASLLWMFANYALKGIVGLICVQKVSRKLFQPTDTEDVKEEIIRLETPPGFTNPT